MSFSPINWNNIRKAQTPWEQFLSDLSEDYTEQEIEYMGTSEELQIKFEEWTEDQALAMLERRNDG